MSATNSSGTTVLPPGVQIDSNFVNLNSQIEFTKSRPTTPLPPLVQAYFGNEILQVSVVVFIDESLSIDLISVYYDKTQETPVFYATYNAPETTASKFNAYQVNFTIEMPQQPKTIETFVWDEDPKMSRGTTTTVQP